MLYYLATLIDSILSFGGIHIGTIDHYITGCHALFDLTGFARESVNGVLHSDTAHISRLLSNDKINHAIFQVSNGLLRRIKVGNFYDTLLIGVLDSLSRPFCTEQIGTKNTRKIGVTLQNGRNLLSSRSRTVVII